MNRAVRRHPVKQDKSGRAGAAAAIRPLRRAGPARGAPGREDRSLPARLFGWRPRFLMDIISELRKVVWPSRENVVHLTVVVVVVTLILGAIFGAIDIGFGWLIDNTLLR